MQENGSLTGFNIDLWNAIAAQLQLKTDYQVLPDIASLLESMRSKNADVVVSPIVITAARDKEFDFSLPTMQAGFQIMVRATGEAAAPDPLADLLILLFSKTTAVWLGIAVILVLVPAHFRSYVRTPTAKRRRIQLLGGMRVPQTEHECSAS
jgi:polar amino acid transport system substrate-binding protein